VLCQGIASLNVSEAHVMSVCCPESMSTSTPLHPHPEVWDMQSTSTRTCKAGVFLHMQIRVFSPPRKAAGSERANSSQAEKG
uniref:Uncharacterized protein n=1 Tax=Coturnix japonica TaxID=93934 RepID=A0A8C2TUR9_COTJA